MQASRPAPLARSYKEISPASKNVSAYQAPRKPASPKDDAESSLDSMPKVVEILA